MTEFVSFPDRPVRSFLLSGSFTKDIFIAVPEMEGDQSYSSHNISHHTEINFGGCASNIAYGLAARGVKVVLSGSLNDPAYAVYLARQGIQLVGNHRDKIIDHFVTISDSVSEKISFFSRGAGENRVRPTDRDIEGVDYLIISADSYHNMYYHKYAADRHGKPYCADLGPEVFALDECQILSLLDGADFIIMNDPEYAAVNSRTNMEISDLRAMARIVVITHGAAGATLYFGDRKYFEPSSPATYRDSTGAGDAFRASLFYSLLVDRECDPAEALRLAHINAAACIATVGGQNYKPVTSLITSR